MSRKYITLITSEQKNKSIRSLKACLDGAHDTSNCDGTFQIDKGQCGGSFAYDNCGSSTTDYTNCIAYQPPAVYDGRWPA